MEQTIYSLMFTTFGADDCDYAAPARSQFLGTFSTLEAAKARAAEYVHDETVRLEHVWGYTYFLDPIWITEDLGTSDAGTWSTSATECDGADEWYHRFAIFGTVLGAGCDAIVFE